MDLNKKFDLFLENYQKKIDKESNYEIVIDKDEEAAKRKFKYFKNMLIDAISNKKNILIFADYDVDGIPTALFLQEMIGLMADAMKKYSKDEVKKYVHIHIPSRSLGDPYGIQIEQYKIFSEDYDYIIAVDNGTHRGFVEKIIELNPRNFFAIDHHPNGNFKNYDYIINPNTDGNMNISTGIIMQIIWEKIRKTNSKFAEVYDNYYFSDLATLSAISDIADINNKTVREIVKNGIEKISKKERAFYYDTLKSFTDENDITLKDIAFKIVPLLNSVGRTYDRVNIASEILSMRDRKDFDYKDLFSTIFTINKIRKSVTQKYSNEVIKMLQEKEELPDIIYIHINSNISGIVGLIAGNVEKIMGVPTIVTCWRTAMMDSIVGSGRGEGIKTALESIKNYEIFSFGGHNQAVGISLKEGVTDDDFRELIKQAKLPKTRDTKPLIRFSDFIVSAEPIFIKDYKALSKELSIRSNYLGYRDNFYAIIGNFDIVDVKDFKDTDYSNVTIKDKTTGESATFLTNYYNKDSFRREYLLASLDSAVTKTVEINNNYTGDFIGITKDDYEEYKLFLQEKESFYSYKEDSSKEEGLLFLTEETYKINKR